MMHQEDMDRTLLSARKAYRFLFEYQTRIKDLAHFISTKYDFKEYFGGYPKFSNASPGETKGSLKNWAWDWLNMYCYEFHFNKKLNENEELKFAIFHFADTGYFDSVDIPTKKDARKLKTNTFSNVKNSRSLLIFVAGKNYWVKDCHEWNNTWSFKDFIDKSFGIQTNEKGGVLVFKQYDLAKFYDESSTLFCMKDFENLCEQNSIPIKIQDSFIKKN
ncbi:conserved hypothetical protein [Moraxellaceae bacterium 17A]|nr:conserved hypothetical protein [Moraxellaceae bacterium 17A]